MKKFLFIFGGICLLALPSTLIADYVNVHGNTFTNGGGDATWYTYNGTEQYLYMTSSVTSVSQRWWAPVHFPVSGTSNKVVRLSARLYDTDATNQIQVYLYKINLYNGNRILVASLETGTSAIPGETLIHDNTTVNRTIDNDSFAWVVNVYFSSADAGTSLRLYGVKIGWN